MLASGEHGLLNVNPLLSWQCNKVGPEEWYLVTTILTSALTNRASIIFSMWSAQQAAHSTHVMERDQTKLMTNIQTVSSWGV